MNKVPADVARLELFAWVGEDEHGSGKIGLKQAIMPAGCVPLVAVDDFKVDRDYVKEALQHQANVYGKTIRLCRFVFVQEIVRIDPEPPEKNPFAPKEPAHDDAGEQ